MTHPAYPEIARFARTASKGAFRVEKDDFALDLLKIVDRPDRISQDRYGFCGAAAFLRAWARRSPVSLVQFAASLYTRGCGRFGSYEVYTDPELRALDYYALQRLYARAQPGGFITPAVWVLCSALINTTNPAAGFEGRPDEDWSWGASPYDLERYLRYSGLYLGSTIKNEMSGFINRSIDQARALSPSPFTDVFLNIQADLLNRSPGMQPLGKLPGIVPNHFVMLNKPIQALGSEMYRIDLWSWGQNLTFDIPRREFESSYYGSISASTWLPAHPEYTRAHSNPKPPQQARAWREWPPDGTVADGPVADGTPARVHVVWEAPTSDDEWYQVRREGAGAAAQWLVWPDPDSGGLSITDEKIDPGARYSYAYTIMAFNTKAASSPVKVAVCDGAATPGFTFAFYAETHPDQVLDPGANNAADVVLPGGRKIGRIEPDGSARLFTWQNEEQPILPRGPVPAYIQRLAVYLEYFIDRLTQAPFSFPDLRGGRKIDVYVTRARGETGRAFFDRGYDQASLSIPPHLPGDRLAQEAARALFEWAMYPLVNFPGVIGTERKLWMQMAWQTLADYLLEQNANWTRVSDRFAANPSQDLRANDLPLLLWRYACSVDPHIVEETWWEGVRARLLNFETMLAALNRAADAGADAGAAGGGSGTSGGGTGQSPVKGVELGGKLYRDALVQLFSGRIPGLANATAAAGRPFSGVAVPPAACSRAVIHPDNRDPACNQTHRLGAWSVRYVWYTVDPGAGDLSVFYQASPGSDALLQLLFLDAHGAVVEAQRTTAERLEFSVGRSGRQNTSITQVLAVASTGRVPSSFCLYLRSEAQVVDLGFDSSPGRSGLWIVDSQRGKRDVYRPVAPLEIHVRARNYGCAPAPGTIVRLYYQPATVAPDDSKWLPANTYVGAKQNSITLDVPAGGAAEGVLLWEQPPRSHPLMNSLHPAPYMFMAVIEHPDDSSPHNNSLVLRTMYVEMDNLIRDVYLLLPQLNRPWDPWVKVEGRDIRELSQEIRDAVQFEINGANSSGPALLTMRLNSARLAQAVLTRAQSLFRRPLASAHRLARPKPPAVTQWVGEVGAPPVRPVPPPPDGSTQRKTELRITLGCDLAGEAYEVVVKLPRAKGG